VPARLNTAPLRSVRQMSALCRIAADQNQDVVVAARPAWKIASRSGHSRLAASCRM
jgi:hypothetical protein